MRFVASVVNAFLTFRIMGLGPMRLSEVHGTDVVLRLRAGRPCHGSVADANDERTCSPSDRRHVLMAHESRWRALTFYSGDDDGFDGLVVASS